MSKKQVGYLLGIILEAALIGFGLWAACSLFVLLAK